jgi:dipeptidyl aminopeptidase/acylaminoacyl peptidase
MKKVLNYRLFYLIVFSVLLVSCSDRNSKNQQSPIIPLTDFFRNPDISYLLLSPDGDKISFTKPYKSRMNVFVTKIGSIDTFRVTSVEDRNISSYFWKTNNRIIYVKDNGGDENFHLFAVDADGKNPKDLTPFKNVRVQIIDELIDYEDEVLIEMNKRNPELFDVYRLNIKTGDMISVAENPGGISNWITDHTGTIRVAVQTDGVRSNLLYRENEKSPFKVVLQTSFKEQVNPLFFSFDNKYIYACSNLNRDKSAIVKFDISKGKEIEVLFEHPDVDLENLDYSRKRKVLTSVTYHTEKTEMKFLDKTTEDTYSKLKQKLGNQYEIIITSTSKNEDKCLVRTMSDRSLGTSYFYDITNDELTKIIERAPWINEDDMSEMKPISYKSKDGIVIHGYLTLPKGLDAKNLPVVINPHGGPWARDFWGFNPEVQFLANRGYAVLQMNFRGSTGYGRKFWESSFKQWGRTMQQDISDGVNWLVSEGIADPKRVAIYGASYGGYATLAGLTFTPELYACGVDYVGVSNMFTFMGTIPPYWKPYQEMFHEMVGNPHTDSIALREVSPVFYVDKIRAPLFIAQGANDPRVNKAESDQVVEALKKRGVQVEYMVKDNEGHGFANEENQFDFYGSMEHFLAKHIGGRISNNSPK